MTPCIGNKFAHCGKKTPNNNKKRQKNKNKNIRKIKRQGKKEKRKRKQEKEWRRKTKQKQKHKQSTASHPSVKGQRPQERWIGATGNHRRHPLPKTVLSALVHITGYRCSGCRQYKSLPAKVCLQSML